MIDSNHASKGNRKIALSWHRDSILRPSERMSTILPQDHSVLADSHTLFKHSTIPYNDIIACYLEPGHRVYDPLSMSHLQKKC